MDITSNISSCSHTAVALLESSVDKCADSFSFRHINTDTILKAFKTINIKNTEDLWGISTNVARTIINSLAPQLADIFNRCLEEGTFPNLMKHAKIIPLFKAGDKNNPSNFRPISILPAFSKVFEKIIYNQLLSHFAINKLFHEKQFGFTKGRSTTDAGVALLKHIFDAWEGKQDAIGIFCDLSKAFDCVSHETLINKLEHYGVSKIALSLIQSYLSNRTQKVVINGAVSSGAPITIGVPQGSILGPLLFLIYINDLPYFARNLCETVLFADDTSLIFNVKRGLDNVDDVNSALSKVLHWFTINNLLLNSAKTKCVKFSLPNVRQVSTQIKMNDNVVELVDSTVFLGIKLDSRLQWDPHIDTLSGRLSSAAYAVKKIRLLTDVETARVVYFSYFHSVMSYGLLLWGSAANIDDVFILQKRAVRAIYNLKSRDSLKEVFKKIDILTIASQFIFENIMFVKKYEKTFVKNCDLHNLNTRRKNKLAVPSFRLHKTGGSFLGKCVTFYNKLPLNITEMPLHTFKDHVKKTLMSKGYYKVEDYVNDKYVWT